MPPKIQPNDEPDKLDSAPNTTISPITPQHQAPVETPPEPQDPSPNE